MKLQLFTFALIIILIIFIIYNYIEHNKYFKETLEGLWVADENFCRRSEIDGMLVYIGPYSSETGDHSAYSIMYIGDVIVNKKFTIKFKFSTTIPSFEKTGNILLETQENEKLDMPKEQNCVINLIDGKMTWSTDEKNYAELFKDHIGTFIGKNA